MITRKYSDKGIIFFKIVVVLSLVWNLNAQTFLIEELSGGLKQIAPSVVMIDYSENNHGTGVIVGAKAGSIFILTAEHVVRDVVNCSIRYHLALKDTIKYPGKIIQRGPKDTVSLIRVNGSPKGAKFVVIGKSRKLNQKLPVGTIGYPHGLEGAQSIGVIAGTQGDQIYFEAKLRTGNSGGPLFNKRGHMIGIVQYIEKEFEDKAAALALKSDVFKPILDDWLDKLNVDIKYQNPFSIPLWGKAALVVGAGFSIYRLVNISDRPGSLQDPPGVPEVK